MNLNIQNVNASILNIIEDVVYQDESIVGLAYHTHLPYTSTTFNNNDEIRIPINQQDVYTLPCESYLHIKLEYTNSNGIYDQTLKLCSNALAFLFDEIRYEISGSEVDRVKNVGITSTIKNMLTIKPYEINTLENSGWASDLISHMAPSSKDISFCIPLKRLFGFAEDFKKILLNVKQELVLIRASTDNNAVILPESVNTYKFKIKYISWRIPYVYVNDVVKVDFLKIVQIDRPLLMPFRKWELYEYPSVPKANKLTWTVKTSSQSDKPRYVIVGFQTDRKNNVHKNPAHFDLASFYNVKLYLNSEYYPYDNFNGETSILHEYYSIFQSSYYYNSENSPMINRSNFLTYTPFCVIDCSKQNESLKTGSIDIRLDIETSTDIPEKTTIYCLIFYDTIMQYTPLSGTVRKVFKI